MGGNAVGKMVKTYQVKIDGLDEADNFDLAHAFYRVHFAICGFGKGIVTG